MDTKVIADYTSEQAVLASVLRRPSEYVNLSDIVKPDDFQWVCYGWAWRAMSKLHEQGMTIDVVTLADELKRENRLLEFSIPSQQFTGRAAISKLKDIQTSESGMSYALKVQDYSAKNKLFNRLPEWTNWCKNGRTASNIVADIQNDILKVNIANQGQSEHVWETDRASEAAILATETAEKGGSEVITGLIDLDKLLAPQRTDLIIYAARPGQGKSGLCGTTALANAIAGKRTLLFTIEMGAVQVTQRLIAQMGDLSAFKIMRGRLDETEKQKYLSSAEEYKALKPCLLTIDKPAIKISQLRLEARRFKPDVIIVDYIQLAEADKKNERRDLDIGEIARGLKAIAKEMNACVFAAAQVGRAAEARADREPTLADLAESGAIENTADSVVFIHHGDALNFSQTKLMIAKHRNGPIGMVNAFFAEEPVAFRDAVKVFNWENRKDVE